MLELGHIFKQFISYVYIAIQSIIMGTRHEHTLKFTVFNSRPSSLLIGKEMLQASN
jgi:hypothetical protein